MKNAGWVFCGAFLNIASLVSFYTVFDSIKTAIVYTMPIIILSLAIVIVDLAFTINKLKKAKEQVEAKLEEEKNRNSALAAQYSKKKHKLENTESLWVALNTVFLNSIQGSTEDRFNRAYELYLMFTNSLNNNNEED